MLFAEQYQKYQGLSTRLTELYKHEARTRTPSMHYPKDEPIPEDMQEYASLTTKDMRIVDIMTSLMTHVMPSNTSTQLLFRLCYMIQNNMVTLANTYSCIDNATVFSEIVYQHYSSMVCHETLNETSPEVREALYPLPCTRRAKCRKIHNPFLLCDEFTRFGFCYNPVHRNYTLEGEKPKPKDKKWQWCEHMCMHCEIFRDDAYPPDPDHRWNAKAEYDLKFYASKIMRMYEVMSSATEGHKPVVNDYLQGLENEIALKFNISPANVERLKYNFHFPSLPGSIPVNFRQAFFEPYDFPDFLANLRPYTLGDDDRQELRSKREKMAQLLGTAEYMLPCAQVLAKEFMWPTNGCVDMMNLTKFMHMSYTPAFDIFMVGRYTMRTVSAQLKFLQKHVMPLVTTMPLYLTYAAHAKVMRSFNSIPRGLAHNNQIFWTRGTTVVPNIKDGCSHKLRNSYPASTFHVSIKQELNYLPDAAFELIRNYNFGYESECIVAAHRAPACQAESIHVIALHNDVFYRYVATRQGAYLDCILYNNDETCFTCFNFIKRTQVKTAPSTSTPIPTPIPVQTPLPSSSVCKKEKVNITGPSLCAKGNDPFAPKKAKRRNRRK